ncbi:MAG: hypothetical protein N2559_12885 [Anaerolineae bacterium]|nr:hypothetical protein [Anaerolineae bacterium]
MTRGTLVLVLLSGLALVAAGIIASPSFARFTELDAAAGNIFTTRQLIAPTNLTANARGHDVSLAWNAGQNGNGYAVFGVSNGISSDCSGVTYSPIVTTTTTIYTDTNRYSPQGTFFCYQVKTIYNTWSSIANNPTAAAQIGFVANWIRMNNGGTAGQLDPNDQIVITFNQPVDTTTGPTSGNTVCTETSGTILLASTAISGSCHLTETVTLGKISGGAISTNARFNATYTWGNANQTITVTIGNRIEGASNPSISSATWTFTPTTDSAKLKSATGAFHVCDTNAGGGNCLPTTTTTP